MRIHVCYALTEIIQKNTYNLINLKKCLCNLAPFRDIDFAASLVGSLFYIIPIHYDLVQVSITFNYL